MQNTGLGFQNTVLWSQRLAYLLSTELTSWLVFLYKGKEEKPSADSPPASTVSEKPKPQEEEDEDDEDEDEDSEEASSSEEEEDSESESESESESDEERTPAEKIREKVKLRIQVSTRDHFLLVYFFSWDIA